MDDLLAKEMNQAKIFYKYLTELKQNPKQRSPAASLKIKDSPAPLTKEETHRRRASETRAKSIGPVSGQKYRSRSTSREKQHHQNSTHTSLEESSENKENNIIDPATVAATEKIPTNTDPRKSTATNRILQSIRNPTAVPISSVDHHHHDPTLQLSRNKTQRQRAATLGERNRGRWGISPSQDPYAKMFSVESKMTISQILDNLKICFAGLELEFTEKKQKNSVKIKGRLSDGSRKKTQVIVEVKPLDDGNIVLNLSKPKNTVKKRASTKRRDIKERDNFPEVCKKIEENLIV
jgi:hypothetical protein